MSGADRPADQVSNRIMRAQTQMATATRPSLIGHLSRIPNRVWVSILVVMLIGLGEPLYAKARYAAREDLDFITVTLAGWGEVMMGFYFAVMIVAMHESWRAFWLKRWPYGTHDARRQIVIFAGSVVYGALGSAAFVAFFGLVVYNFGFNLSFAIDQTFTAILIPIAISGISESFGFRSAYADERLAREEAGRAAAEARYDALKNRLAPHFLFNSLGALAQTAVERPQAVERFVRSLSDIYRYVLQTEGRERASLKEDWKAASAFLEVQAQRRPDTFNLSVEIPDEVMDRELIPMSLLTLVENALKHNVATRNAPLDIHVSADANGITITNPVRPVLSVESSGIGLSNLSSRFGLAGAGTVVVSNTDDVFTVTLPWLPERAA